MDLRKGTMNSPRGSLVLLLHAHLPWVKHPELSFFHEEQWLYEATAETYLPLIHMLRGLERDRVPARITIDVSPCLAAMLCDDLLRARTMTYLERLLELSGKEVKRTKKSDTDFIEIAAFYADRLQRLIDLYEEIDRDVPRELARLEDAGLIELATCGATHPILPMLMDWPALLRGQVRTAVREHERVFGRRPRGIWLPECAYAPGVDRFLAEAGLSWFIVDSHGIETAHPTPRHGAHAPVLTEYGVAAFGRDVQTVRHVWSSETGYPGDTIYREFYRDVGWDLPHDYIAPYIDPDGSRLFTGLKYYRITDRESEHREPYVPDDARQRATDHAGHFLDHRVDQAYRLYAKQQSPVITCPFDAELFGHWWFEGPWFLDMVARKFAYDQDALALRTPTDVLALQQELDVVSLEPSTWGAGGFFRVWTEPAAEWCLPHHVGVCERAARMLRRRPETLTGQQERLTKQAVREAMLAQGSDWAFLMSTGTAVEYAKRRLIEHAQRFSRLDGMIESGQVDLEFLELCEERDGLFEIRLDDFV